MKLQSTITFAGMTALAMIAAPASWAGLTMEDFDYGDVSSDNYAGFTESLIDPNDDGDFSDARSGGVGWSGAWTGDETLANGSQPRYSEIASLSYTDANYVSTGFSVPEGGPNSGNPDGGSYGPYGGNPSQNFGVRSFAPQTGTVWMSVLMQSGGDAYNRWARLYLNPADASSPVSPSGSEVDYIGLQGDGDGTNPVDHNLRLTIDNSNNDLGSNIVAKDEAHLLILKLETDISGASDRLSIWFDPTISAQTEAGLGTATHVTAGDADIWGDDLNSIGLHIRQQRGQGYIDSLRISYGVSDDLSVQQVLTGAAVPVPEPSAIALVLLGGLAVVGRRRSA